MKKLIGIILVFGILISACTNVQTKSDKIRIVTTIGMITDIVKNVGGDRVEVEGLMGAGVDPHLYQASEGDVARLANADIVFYNGLHLEAKMGEVLGQMNKTKLTVAVTNKIPKGLLLDFSGYPGFNDPHVWFDVKLWIKAVEQVEETLSQYDPEHKEEYSKRAKEYIARLEQMDKYVADKSKTIPKEQRVLVTAHDAFNYFAKAYDFEVIGLQGISTEAEAGTRDVQNLADAIAKRRIKAIFVESSVPERNIRAVKEAVKSRGWDVKIGGTLFSDAMGDEGTKEGTYIGMVRYNIDTIAGALS